MSTVLIVFGIILFLLIPDLFIELGMLATMAGLMIGGVWLGIEFVIRPFLHAYGA